mgnify:CR=1 FL=1|tara:strand:+ start:2839 stop:3861 length:1023 start_codon:yes stop_codon:yes gene_type:complete
MSIPPFLVLALARWLGGCFAVLLLTRLLRAVLLHLASSRQHSTTEFVVRLFTSTLLPIGWLAVLVWGWDALPMAGLADQAIYAVSRLMAVVLIARLINRVFLRLADGALRRMEHPVITPEMLVGFSPMLRTVVWLFALLIYLQNEGLELGAIFAALAGAGIGLGLALQRPVENFTDYLTVLLDQPFSVGQKIRVGDVVGRVEQVGVRSTSIRSLNGQRTVMSNGDLLNATIENLTDLPRRRIVQVIGVTYDTSADQMEMIPELIRSVVESVEDAQFGRAHFISYGDFSLNVEYVFFVPDGDFDHSLDLRHRVNLKLMRCFEDKGIEFAFPTQTLHLKRTD